MLFMLLNYVTSYNNAQINYRYLNNGLLGLKYDSNMLWKNLSSLNNP